MIDKVLFLDIDGVINPFGGGTEVLPSGLVIVKSMQTLSPEHMARLNRLVKTTGCEIVISSTWRVSHNLDWLQTIFEGVGFTGSILSTTPVHDDLPNRSEEIKAWLRAHPTKKFAIVDDFEFSDPDLEPYFVQTDAKTGLLDRHVDRLIDLLQ